MRENKSKRMARVTLCMLCMRSHMLLPTAYNSTRAPAKILPGFAGWNAVTSESRALGELGDCLERLWRGSGEALEKLWRASGEPPERLWGASGEVSGEPLGEGLERLFEGLSRRVSGGVFERPF